MILNNNIQNIDVIMDKLSVSKNLINKYQLRDEVKNECSQFVGIIYKNEDILVSLPYNFMRIKDFQNLDNESKLKNIQVILMSILIYNRTQGLSGVEDFNCSFPINAYNQIYEFYQKYGLYYENIVNVKIGQSGNIDWKTTFRKSNSFINTENNTVVYFPFYQKEKIITNNLITECMAFVLNYTKEYFKDLLSLPMSTELEKFGINYSLLNNKDYVVQQLNKELSHTYKDHLRNLIINLIRFFEKLETTYNYDFSIVQFEFHNVWEHAVNAYLTNHFNGVDPDTTDTVQFNFKSEKIRKFFFQKDSQSYDEAHSQNVLEPDHYYLDDEKSIQYIFDSKYMKELNGLNHKQLIYGFLYGNRAKKTYNTLILPGLPSIDKNHVQGQKHVKVKEEFLPDSVSEQIIYQIRLNEKAVLESFVAEN